MIGALEPCPCPYHRAPPPTAYMPLCLFLLLDALRHNCITASFRILKKCVFIPGCVIKQQDEKAAATCLVKPGEFLSAITLPTARLDEIVQSLSHVCTGGTVGLRSCLVHSHSVQLLETFRDRYFVGGKHTPPNDSFTLISFCRLAQCIYIYSEGECPSFNRFLKPKLC